MDDMQMAAIDLLARFRDMGFVLVVTPLNTPGLNRYISNVRPQDVAPILRGVANSIEQSMVPPVAPLNGNG